MIQAALFCVSAAFAHASDAARLRRRNIRQFVVVQIKFQNFTVHAALRVKIIFVKRSAAAKPATDRFVVSQFIFDRGENFPK